MGEEEEKKTKQKKDQLLRTGFEPVTYGCLLAECRLQSTALPTELSKVADAMCIFLFIYR